MLFLSHLLRIPAHFNYYSDFLKTIFIRGIQMYSISEEMVDEFLVRHNTAVFITTCDLVNSNFTYLNHRLKN